MAAIYLRHSRHGTKVACSEMEAEADEKEGWSRYSVAAILQPSTDAPVELPQAIVTGADIESSELAELRVEWETKFGKRPHHRKSVETLRFEVGAT